MARQASPPGCSGILVVDKARGETSFDVVASARRALGVRRIGHAGTLDPDATGVLPLLVGEATKLMPYLVDQDKEYRAVVRLGLTTDTLDLVGRIVAEAPVPPLSRETLERAVAPLVGRIRQTPPMFSAVHHEGRRLYEIAREGGEVVREAREVVVHSIAVEAVDLPTVTLRIVCGKGTYIRVLAADLGTALGCGATVAHLVRLRVGPFRLDEALPSTALTAASREEVRGHLLAPDAALTAWPVVHLDEGHTTAFLHGQHVPHSGGDAAGRFVRVLDQEGTFIGVGAVFAEGRRVRPERIIHADRSGTRVLPA